MLLKRFNQTFGPFLLKVGIRAQAILSRGSPVNDRPFLDSLVGLPIAKKVVSLEVRDAAEQAVREAQREASSSSWSTRNLFHFTSSKHKGASTDDSSKERLSLEEESNIRLAVFDAYIRAALLPNETWGDVQRWQFNKRLIMWARREYLFAKYWGNVRSAFQAAPSLRSSKQFTRGKKIAQTLLSGNISMLRGRSPENAQYASLPKTSLVMRLFGMERWVEEKQGPSRQREKMRQAAERVNGKVFEFRGGAWSFADVKDDTDLSKLSMGEILELARGHVENCGSFNAFMEEWDIYQVWTQEYVQGLGNYIAKRCQQHGSEETIVLEVGAGDGILAELLKDYFKTSYGKQKEHQSTTRNRRSFGKRPKQQKLPKIIATDDYSWPFAKNTTVEKLSYQGALEKYCRTEDQTVIVLCSWMPMNQDWTAAFRDKRVAEYILLGECDDGQCGDNWATWGNPHMFNDDLSEELKHMNDGSKYQPPEVEPLYKADGYSRKTLRNLVLHQLSRYDSKVSKSGQTVSFRRNPS